MDVPSRPVPEIIELTRPFWDAARKHILLIQKCGDCGFRNYPPKPYCDHCGSENLAYERVSGRGQIYSYTITYEARVPSFKEKVPYMTVAVELGEQPGLLMVTNLLGGDPQQVKIGQQVEVAFEQINDEITLPQFRIIP